MKSDRRQFLFGVPALTGLSLLPAAAGAQDEAISAPPDPELVQYWTRMGVPAHDLPKPANTVLGAAPKDTLFLGGVDSEPIFLYVDPDKHELFPAQELPKDRTDQMLKGTDAQVQIAMQRLRLSGPDQKEFQSYNSGGLLFDVQQGKAGAPSASANGSLAWSVFSAIFPSAKPAGGAAAPSGGNAAGKQAGGAAGKSKKDSRGMTALSGAVSALQIGTSSPALQPVEQVHTIQLPNGVGKTKLTVFVKDRKKSLFGTLVTTFGTMAGGAAGSYLSLLNLGAIAQPALKSVQTMVGNLHLNDQQRMVFGTANDIDLLANRDQLEAAANAVRLIPGNYLVVRKGHLSQFSGKTTNIKMFDGYLIENKSDFTQYYEQAAAFASGVSYISLGVTVKGNKLGAGGCKLPEA
jgi:hypothetical protein